MRTISIAMILVASMVAAGCSNKAVVGTAAGAGVAGVGYEAYNKKRIEDNEDAFRDGEISRQEYERRKKEIEDRSVVY